MLKIIRNKSIFGIFLFTILLTSCSDVFVFRIFHGNESKWTETSKENIPPVVKNAFAQKYPGITSQKWYKFPQDRYAVVFEKNGMKHTSLFSAFGVFEDEDLNYQDEYYDDYNDYFDNDNYD
ncbi:MAG: hypothetical protein CVU05_14405 [Bacteroidetes bacterium HGW-Bacteroidetes-21]|jgi:hypothetical protein|nr:MAG: hypothetical protein CVU05_14405 [Bacteroidetes bacterium HGW-Bacteroidetes-21]